MLAAKRVCIMYRRRRKSLVGVLSLVVVTALGSGCSGNSDTKSFTLAVPAEITPVELFQAALGRVIELCNADSKLVEVTWSFSKADTDNPIAVEYQTTPYPQRQRCDTPGVRNVDPAPTSTSKGK
jgi:hypothetical protein